MPSPIALSQRETVESAIPSTSAISAAVMRSLRRASINSTVATGVLEGTRLGAEERLVIGSPARWRATHLATVLVETPAAAEASA